MRFVCLFTSVFLVGLVAHPALAERELSIASPRIYLSDVVPHLSASSGNIDLGASPKAGSSRLFTVSEINRAIQDSGEHVTVVDSVRVVRATVRWSQQQLVEQLTSVVKGALPVHAQLVRMDAPRSLLVPANAKIGSIGIGQLPKRRGTVNTTAVVTVESEGTIEQRLTLPLTLDLAEPPVPVTIPRGHEVTVSIRRGATTVSAIATALQSVTVSNVGLFRVTRTNKVVRARATSLHTAEVVSQ